MYCPYCGEELDNNIVDCPRCKKDVSAARNDMRGAGFFEKCQGLS
jgi:predicted amidophosphoribosyltransferase